MSDDWRLVQVITPHKPIELPVEELSHLPESERARQVERISLQQASAPFDLARRPPFRVRVLRLGEAEHVLLLTAHHVICDGWSLEVLANEVTQTYQALRAGHVSPASELPVQYADYAVWQRDYLQGETMDALLGYWRNKLDGLTPLELPTDRPRQLQARRSQLSHIFQIPHSLKLRLSRVCSEVGVTPYMLLVAVFQTILRRYSGTDDVAIGTPVANRRQPETEGMIGLFVNTLVLRSDLSGDPSFRELLCRVRQTAVEAYDHQEMPFERLVAEMHPQRDLTRHPLVQVMFNFHQRTTSQRVERQQELAVEFLPTQMVMEAAEVFDLVLMLEDNSRGLSGEINYDGNLFDAATVARFAGDFQSLLEAVAVDADQHLSQLSPQGEPRQPARKPSDNAPPATEPKPRYVAPQTNVEKELAAIWATMLRLERVGSHDNFFDLGGHSLLAVRMMVQIRAAFGVDLPVATLFAAPTVAEMADRIETAGRGETGDVGRETQLIEEIAASLLRKSSADGQSLAPLRVGGSQTPLFCIHGLGGHVAVFLPLARGLPQDRPVYGLQGLGLEAGQEPHDRIDEMAAFYLREMRRVQPSGPYLLSGWSMGGLIAIEAANQLVAAGEEVSLLAMFDTHLSLPDYEKLDMTDQSVLKWIAPQLNLPLDDLKKLSIEQQWKRVAEQANLADGIGVAEIRRLAAVCRRTSGCRLALPATALPWPLRAIPGRHGPRWARSAVEIALPPAASGTRAR